MESPKPNAMRTKPDHLYQCGDCGTQDPPFLYNLRHRGIYRRMCTSCVLNNNLSSFCPLCFDVYDHHPPPSHLRVMCLHCPSISHLQCVRSSTTFFNSAYQCPQCSNPNFTFFKIGGKSNTTGATPITKRVRVNDGKAKPSKARTVINEDLAKQLVAAARIAAASMNKAAVVATVEAERRVKEAAVARGRAKEALERVAYLVAKEKLESTSMPGQHKVKPQVDTCTLTKRNLTQNQIRADEFESKNTEKVRGGKEGNRLHSGHSRHMQSGYGRQED
ncbi:unnamed protein product [Ilex paraguariensis]|uniref:RING-type domain-containing protein n=1 Tax=Ilex paraguariensis TaxID=185542 RepID=A0ABC8TLN8_9AQUA